MISQRRFLFIALLLLGLGLAASQSAHAQAFDPDRLIRARRLFLNDQLTPSLQPGSVQSTALNPFALQAFNNQLASNGFQPPVVPPADAVLPADTLAFRRLFTLQVFADRSLASGGVSGGVEFTPEGSPIAPVRTTNIFNFFPVFRRFF